MTLSAGTSGAPTVEIVDSHGAWKPVDGLLLEVDQLQVEFRTRDGVAKAIDGVSSTFTRARHWPFSGNLDQGSP